MTNAMILTSTLSIFHSFRVILHLALPMVYIFHSWWHTQDAAHIVTTLDIAINVWLMDSYLRAMKWNAYEKFIKNFYGRYFQISLGSIWKIRWFIHSLTRLIQWYNLFWSPLPLLWFCCLDCHFLSFDASCDGGRQCLLNPEHLVVLSAGPISHSSIHLLIINKDFGALY